MATNNLGSVRGPEGLKGIDGESIPGPPGPRGIQGEPGAVLIPTVHDNGDLSWEIEYVNPLDEDEIPDLTLPKTVNITGEQGKQGNPGQRGLPSEIDLYEKVLEKGYIGTEEEFYNSIANCEKKKNKVNVITKHSTDIEYPSVKALNDIYNDIITYGYIAINITAKVSPDGSGSVVGNGKYGEGETVNLVANENTGYVFKAWKENDEIVHEGSTYTFIATENRNLIAAFKTAPRVPDGYEELEYVDFNGSTRFDSITSSALNIYNGGWELVVELLPASKTGYFFGLYSSTSGSQARYSDNSLRYDANTNTIIFTSYRTMESTSSITSVSKNATSGKMSIQFRSNYFYVNNSSTIYIPKYGNGVPPSYTPVALGCTGVNSSDSTFFSNYMIFRFYELRISSNHYIPCRRLSDQKVGLYDLTQRSFSAPTAGTLGAGPTI